MNETAPAPYVTKMDKRGRLVIRKSHRAFMGLPAGGPIEWFINEDGHVALRAETEVNSND